MIEKLTGQSYYDYVQQYVYAPTGMTRTGSLPENQAVADRSIGYTKPPGTTTSVPNTDTLPYRGTSAGGGYSTVEDLARFAHALLSHKLLRPDLTKLANVRRPKVSEDSSTVGLTAAELDRLLTPPRLTALGSPRRPTALAGRATRCPGIMGGLPLLGLQLEVVSKNESVKFGDEWVRFDTDAQADFGRTLAASRMAPRECRGRPGLRMSACLIRSAT